jgi:hypothetical protein
VCTFMAYPFSCLAHIFRKIFAWYEQKSPVTIWAAFSIGMWIPTFHIHYSFHFLSCKLSQDATRGRGSACYSTTVGLWTNRCGNDVTVPKSLPYLTFRHKQHQVSKAELQWPSTTHVTEQTSQSNWRFTLLVTNERSLGLVEIPYDAQTARVKAMRARYRYT